VPELSPPPVPLLCAQEADANTIVAATIAIIAIHFAIFTSLLSRPFCHPRIRDTALQAQEWYGLNLTLWRMRCINSS
jgi:hypothetical protein